MKGKARIAGKEYECEVIDGERFIDGKPIDEFLATLDPLTIQDMVTLGRKALDDEQRGEFSDLQRLADALHSRRGN